LAGFVATEVEIRLVGRLRLGSLWPGGRLNLHRILTTHVGRENVVAGADCGFSSQATYHTEVHPTVVWAKFEAMREGARLVTKQLWS
jgi:hypothetical protein